MFIQQQKNLNFYLYYNDIQTGKRSKVSLRTSDIKLAQKLLLKYQTLPSLIYSELKMDRFKDKKFDHLAIQKLNPNIHYLDTLITNYIKHSELNHTPKTQRVIKQTFKFFCAYLVNHDFKDLKDKVVFDLIQLVKNYDIKKIDKVLLDSYLQKRLSVNSLYQSRIDKINLSGFFSYLVNQNILSDNPISKVKLPKIPSKLPIYLKQSEFDLVLSNTESEIMKYVFIVAYYTGMRLGEIITLRFSMLDFTERIIKLDNQTNVTKSKRFRVIPMNQMVYDTLLKLQSNATSDFVFESLPSNNTSDYVGKFFKKVIRKLNLDNRLHFHSLRHSFATNLAQKGIPVTVIQKLLGHQNIQTTMIYTHTSNTQLKDAIAVL
ncbi:MAG: hypothetical protein AMXMBFR49_27700 [Chlorobiota bacterium]